MDDGGLQIQVRETSAALGRLGVEVVPWDVWSDQVPEVDVVHLFSVDSALVAHVRRAVELGVPVVASPVFNAFDTSPRRLRMLLRAGRHIPGMSRELETAGTILRLARKVICLNEEEARLLESVFGLDRAEVVVVPNGTTVFDSGEPSPGSAAARLTGSRYVIQVGRITPVKNQLTSIRAVRDWPGTLAILGRAGHADSGYAAQCRAEAGSNVLFLDPVAPGSADLRALYEGAAAVLLPSTSEVMSLVLLEAGALGRPVVVSRHLPVPDVVADRVPVVRIDGRSGPDLRRAIESLADTAPRPRPASPPSPTWVDVAAALRDIYDAVLGTR